MMKQNTVSFNLSFSYVQEGLHGNLVDSRIQILCHFKAVSLELCVCVCVCMKHLFEGTY